MTDRNMLNVLIEEINGIKNNTLEIDKCNNIKELENKIMEIDDNITKLNQKKEEIKQKINSLKNNFEDKIENENIIVNKKDKNNQINLQLICNNDKEKLTFLSIDNNEQKGLKLKEKDIDIFINGIKYNLSDCLEKTFYKGLYHIKLIFKKKITKCQMMFSNCTNIESIDLSSFAAKNVINMSGMFYNCENLKSVNLSSLNTQNVIDMSQLFLIVKA